MSCNEKTKYRCIYPLHIRLITGKYLKINVGDIFDFDFQLANGVSIENKECRVFVEQKNFDFCFEKVE